MKKQTKFTALILALLMVLSCLFACGKNGKVKPESVTDKYNEQEYAKLKGSSDKLLWFPRKSHPAAANVTTVVGKGGEVKELFESAKSDLKNFEGSFEFAVDKMMTEGSDALDQLGGPLKMTGKVLTGEKAVNGDLGVTAGTMNVSFKLAADESGVLLDSPFIFKQPVFVPKDRIAGLLTGIFGNLADKAEIPGSEELSQLSGIFSGENALGDQFEKLKEWKEEKFSDANVAHLTELLKGCVPADAVTVSKVTPPELKGEFITFDVETECVELKLTSETAQKFLQDLLKALKEDAVMKDIVVSLIETFGEEIVENLTGEAGKTVGELYDELIEELLGELDEDGFDSDEDDKGSLTIRRYFAGGRDVKTDVVFSEDGASDSFNFTFWNAYANTNANEFGVKLSAEGSEYVNIAGGSDEKNAKIEGTVSIPDDDDEDSKLGTVKLSAVRKGEKVQAKVDFDVAGDEKTGAGKGGLTFDGDKNTCTLKANYKDTVKEMSIDYAKKDDGGTLTANLSNDGTVISLNGSKKADGSTDVYEAELSVDEGEGEGPQTLKIRCEDKKVQTGEKTEHEFKLKVNSEDKVDIDASLKLSLDKASKNTPEAPVKDGAFEISGETTDDEIKELLSPQFLGIFGGLLGGDDDDD